MALQGRIVKGSGSSLAPHYVPQKRNASPKRDMNSMMKGIPQNRIGDLYGDIERNASPNNQNNSRSFIPNNASATKKRVGFSPNASASRRGIEGIIKSSKHFRRKEIEKRKKVFITEAPMQSDEQYLLVENEEETLSLKVIFKFKVTGL